MKRRVEDTVEGCVRLLEKDLGIKEGFLESLKDQDDWSLVIKLHALIEAAIAYLLCKALDRDELSEVFSFTELSNKRSGKIAFIKKLNLLEKRDIRFIGSISELRNKLVHNISNVDFDFKKYVSSMDSAAFNKFVKKFDNTGQDERDAKLAYELFKRNPKYAIWMSGMLLIGIIYLKKEIVKIERVTAIQKAIYEKKKDMEANSFPLAFGPPPGKT